MVGGILYLESLRKKIIEEAKKSVLFLLSEIFGHITSSMVSFGLSEVRVSNYERPFLYLAGYVTFISTNYIHCVMAQAQSVLPEKHLFHMLLVPCIVNQHLNQFNVL